MINNLQKKGFIQRSFTFIELIIVVGIVGLMLPILFNIIFSLLQQQLKIMSLSEIKRQGDYSLLVMSNTLRNYATGVYSGLDTTDPNNPKLDLTTQKCNTSGSNYGDIGTNLYFSNANREFIHFFQDGNSIASESSVIDKIHLTNSKIKIANFDIQCTRSAQFSTPLISISFDISYNVGDGRDEETAKMKYQTNIKLRNAQ